MSAEDEHGDSEVERVLALGVRLHEDHRTVEGPGWVTLLDPGGNEFLHRRSASERGL